MFFVFVLQVSISQKILPRVTSMFMVLVGAQVVLFIKTDLVIYANGKVIYQVVFFYILTVKGVLIGAI